MHKKTILIITVLLTLGILPFYWSASQPETPATTTPPITVTQPTAFPLNAPPARTPSTTTLKNTPLKTAVIAAGDYLVRQQLPNGELAYQVNILTNDRSAAPAELRLMAGTGALYTVCRVSGEKTYCQAGDKALNHYLKNIIINPQTFKGMCLYANGACPLGGAALTVDTIYRRWQAQADFRLNEQNLLETAQELGYFIVSMRKADGGFYHSFDPHLGGTVDPNYFSATFPGASLTALLQLYEMTGNTFWLEQAREVNAELITQPATEDHWHSYALSLLARLDALAPADQRYAKSIAETIIAGQVRSLNPVNASVSTITKAEALAALAQALQRSKVEHAWLDQEIRTFITFVELRQLPNQNCGFTLNDQTLQTYGGGLIASCEDPTIRVDAVQHWINGVTLYLEYQQLLDTK